VSANEQFGEYGPVLVGNSIKGILGCYGNNDNIADFGAPNSVSEFNVGDCSDKDASAATMMQLVEKFDDLGEFTDSASKRSLYIHLTAIDTYEQQKLDQKVAKHVEGFHVLLDHQESQALISERASIIFRAEADNLLDN